MTEKTTYTMTWTFTPIDFLCDHKINFLTELQADVTEGRIKIIRESDETLDIYREQSDLTTKLNRIFSGIQLSSMKPYELVPSELLSMTEGKRTYHLKAKPIIVKVSLKEPNIEVMDQEGNIVIDTSQEKLANEQKLIGLVQTFGDDPTASKILGFYDDSLKNDSDILFRLYDIRDALQVEFKNQKNAQKKLGESLEKVWKEVGQLANADNVKQSRHRGKRPLNVRDLTEVELKYARTLGRKLVIMYLEYLDSMSKVN